MDLIQPRGTYQRANTDSSLSFEQGIFELSPADSKAPSFKSGYSNTIRDVAPLLDPSTDPIRIHSTYDGRWKWPLFSGHSRLHGWRTGALLAALFAGISLVINFVILIWLATHKGGSGLVELFSGNCSKVETMDMWVHFAINALSTLLLGGSNYCMQCLCAPTRKDIDTAHSKGKWLDIGVPSIRNLFKVPVHKSALWWVLGLSSVPLHLLYNSALYKSLASNDYDILVVKPDFIDGSSWSSPDPIKQYGVLDGVSIDQIQADVKVPERYERLTTAECIRAYATDFTTDRRNLVFVANNDTVNYNLLTFQTYIFSTVDTYYWICESDPDIANKIQIPEHNGDNLPCQKYYSKIIDLGDQWHPWGNEVQYCYSERVSEKCSYNGNIPIVAVVLVANAIKMAGMLFVAYRLRDTPLITMGDAVESFLNEPDRTTEGRCLLTRQEVIKLERMKQDWNLRKTRTTQPKTARPRAARWFEAASWLRWCLTMGFIGFSLIVVGVLLSLAIRAVTSNGFTISDIGFGKVNPAAIITGLGMDGRGSPSKKIVNSILLANFPQTIFSFLYLNLNGLLTSMFLASEWSDFANERKHLRVSKPKGSQRSTHFLQLPYKVAIPLMVFSGLLHWLISQAIFLVVVKAYAPNGDLVDPVAVSTCGFSPLAMIVSIAAGVLIITVTSCLGFFFKYDPTIPLVGSCSAAISAACHPPDWDSDASMKPVKWGVIPETLAADKGVGHCSFTSGDAEPLQAGEEYAGISRFRKGGIY
ncbi:hypothetical protein PV08_06807 [Exophiala spinifera]|uniref:DUF6536 domain-containing protein n=1 Tax=Exophiala spinifera TaxID=91928 RepID=A0A0D1YGB9_9EURO|nr:uncharacterized protein PV08_06807 [Exophiala spinifera]KIW14026.1 hypothetical protein PV08_06807 [Exophiala spinifera]